MAQERSERETAQIVAVKSLKNELELAIRLLGEVNEGRVAAAMEAHVIGSARSAFRHAVEALNRVPQLDTADMDAVQNLIDEFRSALSNLDH